MVGNRIDNKENLFYQIDKSILKILLKDRSSKKNIIWATENYQDRGSGYFFDDPITIKSITRKNELIVKPRTEKSRKEQCERIKQNAEVFTSTWICNIQNNLIDNVWFGRSNVFNIEKDKAWETISDKIVFPNDKTWQDYVKENRLEIACGEAPYLVSRYDSVSGKRLSLKIRIGLLDRKLRVINENTTDEEEWLKWVIIAFKSVYGFELQGDNLLIARENLLLTFMEYYEDRFGKEPFKEYVKEIANIIAWNIWQMDGLNFAIPNCCQNITNKNDIETVCEKVCQECLNNDSCETIYCKIMDWNHKRSVKFISLLNKFN